MYANGFVYIVGYPSCAIVAINANEFVCCLQAEDIISRLREYIAKHPDLIVIDPLDNIRNLRNRCQSYELMQEGIRLKGNLIIDLRDLIEFIIQIYC